MRRDVKKITAALAEDVCGRLAQGEPLPIICRELGLPVAALWQHAAADAAFSAELARAREAGYDALAAQCLSIADDEEHDWKLGVKSPLTRATAITRARLQVETRLKLLSKWDPKRYGEKLPPEPRGHGTITVTIGGDV